MQLTEKPPSHRDPSARLETLKVLAIGTCAMAIIGGVIAYAAITTTQPDTLETMMMRSRAGTMPALSIGHP